MADDFSFLDSAGSLFDDVKNVFDNYIVRPVNAFGLAGFVFDVEGESNITLSADITDHYTEDNTAIQNQIAIKPKRIVLKSYVGELVYRGDGSTNDPLQSVPVKLTTIDGYLPALSAAGTQLKSILDGGQDALNFQSAVNGAINIWGLTKNLNPPIPRQQQAYTFFKALLQQKILVSVDTPFEFCTSMAIENITAVQAEDSRYISDFSITLKEMRFASTQSILDLNRIDVADLPPIVDAQSTALAEKGQVTGAAVSSTLNDLVGKYF